MFSVLGNSLQIQERGGGVSYGGCLRLRLGVDLDIPAAAHSWLVDPLHPEDHSGEERRPWGWIHLR